MKFSIVPNTTELNFISMFAENQAEEYQLTNIANELKHAGIPHHFWYKDNERHLSIRIAKPKENLVEVVPEDDPFILWKT